MQGDLDTYDCLANETSVACTMPMKECPKRVMTRREPRGPKKCRVFTRKRLSSPSPCDQADDNIGCDLFSQKSRAVRWVRQAYDHEIESISRNIDADGNDWILRDGFQIQKRF